jgi:hypothetical protein
MTEDDTIGDEWRQGGAADAWQQEFEAGPEQLIVVYQPDDLSVELDPASIFGRIAEDAAARSASGLRIRTLSSMPLRHAGTVFGNNGSGFETKVAVVVVYERVSAARP